MADDINKRLDALEVDAEGDGGVEELTLRVVYVETYFDERGERRERQLPATYDESQPFPPPRYNAVKRRWTTMRVLHPIGDDLAPHPEAEDTTSS